MKTKYLSIPSEKLWSWLTRSRRFLYEISDKKKSVFPLPVISIGNITFGGTGKTPLTIYVSKLLEQMGAAPLVATRGYKSDFEHTSHLLLSPPSGLDPHPWAHLQRPCLGKYVGDEPKMMSRHLRRGGILIGKKRSKNLAYYLPKTNADVVILDDGFGHLQVARDLDILLFDCMVPFQDYHFPPFGKLRESLQAVKKADIIVLNRVNQVSTEKIEQLKNLLRPFAANDVEWVLAAVDPTGVYDNNTRLVYDINSIKGKKFLAFAGIGHPQSFFNLLSAFGAEVVEHKIYPDHYYFQDKDLRGLLKKAKKLHLQVITTEKDMMRIADPLIARQIFYLGIDLEIKEGEDKLKGKITDTLSLYNHVR